jgi:hypothetical protein
VTIAHSTAAAARLAAAFVRSRCRALSSCAWQMGSVDSCIVAMCHMHLSAWQQLLQRISAMPLHAATPACGNVLHAHCAAYCSCDSRSCMSQQPGETLFVVKPRHCPRSYKAVTAAPHSNSALPAAVAAAAAACRSLGRLCAVSDCVPATTDHAPASCNSCNSSAVCPACCCCCRSCLSQPGETVRSH